MAFFNTSLLAPLKSRQSTLPVVILIGTTTILLLIIVYSVISTFVGNSIRTPAIRDITGPSVTAAETIPQILSMSGEIVSIDNGNSLTIQSGAHDAIGPGVTRRAFVKPATVVTTLAFIPTITGGQKRFAPHETPTSITKLRKGMRVEILASTNIKDNEEFPAVHIRVLP